MPLNMYNVFYLFSQKNGKKKSRTSEMRSGSLGTTGTSLLLLLALLVGLVGADKLSSTVLAATFVLLLCLAVGLGGLIVFTTLPGLVAGNEFCGSVLAVHGLCLYVWRERGVMSECESSVDG